MESTSLQCCVRWGHHWLPSREVVDRLRLRCLFDGVAAVATGSNSTCTSGMRTALRMLPSSSSKWLIELAAQRTICCASSVSMPAAHADLELTGSADDCCPMHGFTRLPECMLTMCPADAGPFANIAHGNSSVMADVLALKLAGPEVRIALGILTCLLFVLCVVN